MCRAFSLASKFARFAFIRGSILIHFSKPAIYF